MTVVTMKQLKSISYNISKKHDFKFISVHQIIAELCIPFDSLGAATKASNNPTHEHYGKTIEEIQAIWSTKSTTGANRGVGLDTFIQSVISKRDHEFKFTPDMDASFIKKCNHFKKFYDERLHNFTDIAGELWICSDKYRIRGRLDRLMEYAQNLVIFDWKNTENLKTTGFNQMLGPMSDYRDSEHVKFTLQTSLYKFMFHELMKTCAIPTAQVTTRIVQVQSENPVTVWKPAFEYSDELMTNIIEFAIAKIDEREMQAFLLTK